MSLFDYGELLDLSNLDFNPDSISIDQYLGDVGGFDTLWDPSQNLVDLPNMDSLVDPSLDMNPDSLPPDATDFGMAPDTPIEMTDPGSQPITSQDQFPDQVSRAMDAKAQGGRTLLDSGVSPPRSAGLFARDSLSNLAATASKIISAGAGALSGPEAQKLVAALGNLHTPEATTIPLQETPNFMGSVSPIQTFNPSAPPPVFQIPTGGAGIEKLFGPQGYDPFAGYKSQLAMEAMK